jgi:nicotinate-nucleotide pyrophosphorylase
MAVDPQNRDSDWTLNTLFIYFSKLMEDAEEKTKQRFDDQEKAVQAALAAAEKAVVAALAAAQKAVDKAADEMASWKRDQNEWRATIADIISKTSGKSSGLDTGWKILLAALGGVVTIITLFKMFAK